MSSWWIMRLVSKAAVLGTAAWPACNPRAESLTSSPTGAAVPPSAAADRVPAPGTAREPSRVPAIVTERLGSLEVRIGIQPPRPSVGPEAASLRGVVLFVGNGLREPEAVWPDGTPMSADVRIAPAQGEALVATLAQRGFFAMAERFYSERRASPRKRPPADSKPGLPPSTAGPNVQIQISVFDDDWYHVFARDYAFGPVTRELLAASRKELTGSAAQLLDRLIVQMPLQ
jgi:hypothetical protein